MLWFRLCALHIIRIVDAEEAHMARKKVEEPAGEVLRRQYDAALGEENEWDEKDFVILELAQRQANDIQALEQVLADGA